MGSVVFLPANALAQTSNTCNSSLSSDFYSKFTLAEGVFYIQTNSSGPTLQGTEPYGFEAGISLETNLSATAATLALPGQAAKPMKRANNQQFAFIVLTNTFANLQGAFPDGTYQFTVANSTWQVTLPSGITLPNTPTLLNYQAAQNIDPTKDFPLTWSALAGGTASDVISVDVRDTNGNSILRTPKYGCAGDLDGTATSLLIPANSLASNQTYRVTLLFAKEGEFNTNAAPHVALIAGTEAQNVISIATTTASGTPQTGVGIANLMLLGGQAVRFDLQTTPGQNFTVQFATDLQQTSGWTNILTGTAASTLTPVTNHPPVSSLTGFYRAFGD